MPKAPWFSRRWGNFCGWQKNKIPTHLLLTGLSSSSPAYTHCPHSLPSVGSTCSLNGNVFFFWPHLTTFQVLLRVTFSMKPFPVPNSSELSSSKLRNLSCVFTGLLCVTIMPPTEMQTPGGWASLIAMKRRESCYPILGVRCGLSVSMWWLGSWVWCIMNT